MKICLVSNLYNPDIIGGAENVVANLANRMAEEGHDVLVIATKQSAFVPVYEGIYQGRASSHNFYLYMEDMRVLLKNSLRNAFLTPIWHALDVWNPYSYYHVRRTIKNFGPDIINTHNIFGMSTAVWSAALSLKIPVAHTLYDYSLLCPKSTRFKIGKGACQRSCYPCTLYSIPKRVFAAGVAAVIAPSQLILDVFDASGMFLTSKKYVIPHGIEGGQKRSIFKQDIVSFLCIGQISEHKGILLLIKAFMKIPSKRAILNVVGLGDSLRTAEKLAMGDKRIIFHHFLDGEAKLTLFEKNSVLVLPSLWEEPFGPGILEAYSHGIPVIASSVGAIPSIVDHGKTGFLVEPGHEADLTQKIGFFLNEANLLNTMSENCLKKAEDFRLDAQVKKYCEVYETVLAAARPGPNNKAA